jgi:hypothetical protein
MARALPRTGVGVIKRPCSTATTGPWWRRCCLFAPGTGWPPRGDTLSRRTVSWSTHLEDIDFATGAAAPVAEIVAELAAAYRLAGFTVQVLDADERKGHLLVTFPLGGTHRVDVLKEPLNHPVVWMEFGPVIALADAVALKMGALHDRALPRDVLDTHGASSMWSLLLSQVLRCRSSAARRSSVCGGSHTESGTTRSAAWSFAVLTGG